MIIEGFYGSALMNVITWNKAYSLFPRMTFLRRGMCVLRRLRTLRTSGVREVDQLEKYERRGWTVMELCDDNEVLNARHVGDRWSWTIEFGENAVEQDDKVESVRFAIGECRLVLLRRRGGWSQFLGWIDVEDEDESMDLTEDEDGEVP